MIDDLIAQPKTAIDAQTSQKLRAVWTTLQSILQDIMLSKGDNTFILPRLKKATTVRRNGSILTELPCSQDPDGITVQPGGVGGGSISSLILTSGTNCCTTTYE